MTFSTAKITAYGATIALFINLTPTYAFLTSRNAPALLNPTTNTFPRNSPGTHLFAEGGPPQYDKIDCSLIEAEPVGKGSVMLHIRASQPIDYPPGHVVALEIENPLASPEKDDDASADAEWMRGPYTVSRCDGERELDILIKVVGAKSKVMAAAKPGTPLKIGGKFKVPILEGVRAEETKRVVMVSTGVGAGPCVGAIERALRDETEGGDVFPGISLIASYRDDDEIIYRDHLNRLVEEFGSERLQWTPVVTSTIGRLSSSDANLELLLSSEKELSLTDTHYHLIGNGQMVNEFKSGLLKAGVPKDRVSLEMYFNHKATASEEVIDKIASFVSRKSGVGSVV